jgi:hypothetical protein
MAAGEFTSQAEAEMPVVVPSDSQTPAYALREIPTPAKMPEDHLGQDLAFLLASHPELALEVGDLDGMPAAAKVALLADLKKRLGIKPIRTRRLGYVGP